MQEGNQVWVLRLMTECRAGIRGDSVDTDQAGESPIPIKLEKADDEVTDR
jgi:hypothetical protein